MLESVYASDPTRYNVQNPVNKRKLTESKMVMHQQASILDENRIVLYKKGKHMGCGYYIIEISSSVSHMYIVAYNIEKP